MENYQSITPGQPSTLIKNRLQRTIKNKSIHDYVDIDIEDFDIEVDPDRPLDDRPYGDMKVPIKSRQAFFNEQQLVKNYSSFDLEANEAEADLSMNAQINTTTLSGQIQVLQGSMGSFKHRGKFLNEHKKMRRTQNDINISQKYNQTVEDHEIKSEDFEVGEDFEVSRVINNKATVFDQVGKKPNSALGFQSDTKILSASKSMGKKFAHIKMHNVKKQMSSRVHENEKEMEFDKDLDFKIVYLDISKSDKVELRIQQKSFEYIPREILQNLQKLNGQHLVSIDISHNKLQEIESSLFLNIDCKSIESLRADHNCLRYVSAKIKDCVSLKTLRLSHNCLQSHDFLPNEFLVSGCPLLYLNLANNQIKELPQNLGKLKSLRTLDLENNKIQSLQTRMQDGHGKFQYLCPISGLENLEELYLNKNRLKDLPTVFQNYKKLKIIGLDWFSYLRLPKVLEEQKSIQLLKNNSQILKLEKKNFSMTFIQFAFGFDENYDIDCGSSFQEEGRTALHMAVMRNDLVMVNNLLKDGANPNLLDSFGHTPLELSLRENFSNVAKQILKFSNKIDFKSAQNSKILMLSVEKLNVELTELLLNQGCNPNQARDSKTGENCLHLLMYKLSCSVDAAKEQMNSLRDNSEKASLMGTIELNIHNYMSDQQKCTKILDALLTSGIDVNAQCNQKYTPFLLAVRLGSPNVIKLLLEKVKTFELDVKGGFGQNTAFHFAAIRTNFDALYELDKWGADIFNTNRDGKTCFNLVNNNLLMLKIVKKLEKKQFISKQIQELIKTQPPELKIIVTNSILINTSEYRQFDELIQKIKKEYMRGPSLVAKRNSIFGSLSRQRNSSQKKLEMVNGKKILRGTTPQQHNQSMLTINSSSSMVVKHKPPLEKKSKKLSIIDFLSKAEQETFRSISYENQNANHLNLKISISKQLEPGKININISQFQKYQQQSKQKPVKLNNLKLKRQDSSNILETHRMQAELKDNDSVLQVQHSSVASSATINQTSIFQQQYLNQNHKNIFFIKDQIFDKERLTQIKYNNSLSIITDSDNFNLVGNPMEFSNGGHSFIYSNRQTQEYKLISQLRLLFSSKLKTHVNVLAEMIEKLHKIKCSPYMVESIIQIARQELMNFDNQYSQQTIRTALDNQAQNVNGQEYLQEMILEILEECPDVRKPLKTFNDKYDVNLEENEVVPSLQIHKYVKTNFSRKFSHQILKSNDMTVPHMKKNPLTNGAQSKLNIYQEIDEQFSQKGSIIISSELKSEQINSFHKIPLLDQTARQKVPAEESPYFQQAKSEKNKKIKVMKFKVNEDHKVYLKRKNINFTDQKPAKSQRTNLNKSVNIS